MSNPRGALLGIAVVLLFSSAVSVVHLEGQSAPAAACDTRDHAKSHN